MVLRVVSVEKSSASPARFLVKNWKRLTIPGLIFLWTVISLSLEAQGDFNFIVRYYGWVFTAQIAFLIFFLPKINWSEIRAFAAGKSKSSAD